MDDIHQSLRPEFERCLARAYEEDEYARPDTVGLVDVVRAHFLIVDYFLHEKAGEGVGGIGPRDWHLLHSAIYRQFVEFGGLEKWPDPMEKLATLVFGLVKDHPFHDANKRTAFLIILKRLQDLRLTPSADESHFEKMLLEIAGGQVTKRRRYQKMVKQELGDEEIRYLANFLSRHTRKIDKRSYVITFRDLRKILLPYDVHLENPSGNFIDVVRVRRKKRLLGGYKEVRERVCKIGFPSWTKEVAKGDVKRIREKCGLMPQDGVDSQSFFKDADPIQALIATYHRPLERLAHK